MEVFIILVILAIGLGVAIYAEATKKTEGTAITVDMSNVEWENNTENSDSSDLTQSKDNLWTFKCVEGRQVAVNTKTYNVMPLFDQYGQEKECTTISGGG